MFYLVVAEALGRQRREHALLARPPRPPGGQQVGGPHGRVLRLDVDEAAVIQRGQHANGHQLLRARRPLAGGQPQQQYQLQAQHKRTHKRSHRRRCGTTPVPTSPKAATYVSTQQELPGEGGRVENTAPVEIENQMLEIRVENTAPVEIENQMLEIRVGSSTTA
eukprot:1181703-Prorocentrum_minimum.AAC.6